MSNVRRRITTRQYLRRPGSSSYRTYKRRRFIRPNNRLPVYNRTTRYTSRPLGNPLAITERKYFDVERPTLAISVPTPDWSVCGFDPVATYSLNAVTVGTSWQQRIGRKIQIISLKIKGEVGIEALSYSGAPPMYAPTIRVVIFVDNQTNGEVPFNYANVLSSGPTSALPVAYFQNGNTFGRFKILRDHRFVLNPMAVTYDYTNSYTTMHSNVKLIDDTIKFNPPLTVHYNGANTGTNADIVDNSLHIMIARDANGAPACFGYFKARIAFYDC